MKPEPLIAAATGARDMMHHPRMYINRARINTAVAFEMSGRSGLEDQHHVACQSVSIKPGHQYMYRLGYGVITTDNLTLAQSLTHSLDHPISPIIDRCSETAAPPVEQVLTAPCLPRRVTGASLFQIEPFAQLGLSKTSCTRVRLCGMLWLSLPYPRKQSSPISVRLSSTHTNAGGNDDTNDLSQQKKKALNQTKKKKTMPTKIEKNIRDICVATISEA